MSLFPIFFWFLSLRKVVLSRKLLISLVTMLLFFLLSSCSTSNRIVPHTSTSTPSSTITLIPTPTLPPLGAVPQNCPPGPTFQTLPSIGNVVGTGPVRVDGLVGPPDALVWSPKEAVQYHTQNGWIHKFLYLVATDVDGLVTIHGMNLQDGSPLLPGADDQAPASTATMLVLDVHEPSITNRVDQWTEFPGALTIPKAGCYALEADWPGGHWQITFAAGEVPSD